MEFKNKVKFVREKLCLSQQDLAKATGISFNTINRWEMDFVNGIIFTYKTNTDDRN